MYIVYEIFYVFMLISKVICYKHKYNMNEKYNTPSTSRSNTDNINAAGETIYQELDIPCTLLLSSSTIPNQDIVDETNSLYFYHLARQIAEVGLQFPIENMEYTTPPRNARSLQALANRFIISPQRRWVHEQAQNVDLESLNFNTFQQLLIGLFQEGGITWERVLVLFYFCTDLSIRALQEKLIERFIRLYNWTTYYIRNRLSIWIQEQGGWDVVLQNSINYATRLSILGFCCIGILAICIYLRRNK